MKIVMICNTDGALYKFRKPLIKELVKKGHEVYSITSPRSPEGSYISKLKDLGVKTYTTNIDNSVNPYKNVFLIKTFTDIIREIKPDIVHSFTHKPAIFGTIAASIAGVNKRFATITGLGRLFSSTSLNTKEKILRQILLFQYKLSMNFATKIFFQNPDDMELFIKQSIINKNKAILTPGSGIDLKEFSCSNEKKEINRKVLSQELKLNLDKKLLILFPAKAIIEKGVLDFYKAASIISKLTDKYVFLHLGSPGKHNNGLSLNKLKKLAIENNVFYLGYKHNIHDYMCACDIVVLPSFYGEGIPRALLEALAMDKIIITTDNRGCRETVIDGWNGFLVKPQNYKDLVSKILKIDYTTLSAFKFRSYKFAKEFFDSNLLVKITIKEYLNEGC